MANIPVGEQGYNHLLYQAAQSELVLNHESVTTIGVQLSVSEIEAAWAEFGLDTNDRIHFYRDVLKVI